MKNNTTPSRRDVIRQLAALPLAGLALNHPLIPGQVQKKSKTTSLIPVMLTPFRDDLSIDWNTFDKLTDFYAQAGADGYFANCLSSEMYYLSPEERLAVTDRVIRRFKGKKLVVSTGSFGETIEKKAAFVRQVNDLGTAAVILITSHFAGKNESDEMLMDQLDKLMTLTGDIPLGTYECPNPYKRVLTGKVFGFLLKSKRFIYHKDTSESLPSIREKLKIAENNPLKFFNAHTATAVTSLQEGGAGLSPISANFYPEILAWLCDNTHNPDKQLEVEWIQKELAETEPLISKGYPVSSKYFLKKRGLPIQTICRSNARTLSSDQQNVLDNVYEKFTGWCERLDLTPVRI